MIDKIRQFMYNCLINQQGTNQMMQFICVMRREISAIVQDVKFVSGVHTNLYITSINDYLCWLNELKKSYGQNLIAVFKINQEIENVERFVSTMYENNYQSFMCYTQ